MAKNTRFEVRYAEHVARFSSYTDAMRFARSMSDGKEWIVEVSDRTGIVGQFQHGAPTGEFREHWRSVALTA